MKLNQIITSLLETDMYNSAWVRQYSIIYGLDVPALNIVMKTTICNGMDAAKISDTPGKGMCKNPDYVDYLNRCIDYRMKNDR